MRSQPSTTHRKTENYSLKQLSLHNDLIIKKGELKQKQSILTTWKTKRFVFDGHCLYNVSNDDDNRESKDEMKKYTILKKYVLIQETTTTSTEEVGDFVVMKVVDAHTLLGKENCLGFFFKDSKAAPLFLMASSSEEHTSWLSILQKALSKGTQDSDSASIHSTVEGMIDLAFITDAFGVIQCVNKAALTFFGYMRTDMVNKNIAMIMPSEYAIKHDFFLDRYRKSGLKRLIGIPRTLPVKLRDGKIAHVIVSLGEIPDSTNSDRERFLGVMKPVQLRQQSQHLSEGDKLVCDLHTKIQQVHKQLEKKLELLEEQLMHEISTDFAPLIQQADRLQHKMHDIEKSNAKLIELTCKQRFTTDYLQSQISSIYSGQARQTPHYSNKEAKNLSFEQVIQNRLALRYFMAYASTEHAIDNFKFYIYIQQHYKTERDLDKLSAKREFIMDTFIKSGSQYELNLSSQQRILIEEQYKQLQIDLLTESTVSEEQASPIDNRQIIKEQAFFDNVLTAVKFVMQDTYSRFKMHPLYEEMLDGLYEADLYQRSCRIISL